MKRLMTYLAFTLAFSIPAQAIYVDGGIACYASEVNAQAETVLDFWDVWDGWGGASVSLQVVGAGSASGTGSAWYPNYWATATASVPNAPSGTYQYEAWHSAYYSDLNTWYLLYSFNTSCQIQGAPGAEIESNWSIKDGDQTTFHVISSGPTPTGYAWSFTTPGGGNNPHVTFGSPSSVSTTVDGHWYANPDNACSASPHPIYGIHVSVNFPGGITLNRSAELTVDALWEPAGDTKIDPNLVHFPGGPDVAPDSNGIWRVTAMGGMTRTAPVIVTLNIPSTSQFYNKLVQHENKHVEQLGGYYLANAFYAQISGLTGATLASLLSQITAAEDSFVNAETARWNQDHAANEQSAYAVSDLIAPRYLYQLCGVHQL